MQKCRSSSSSRSCPPSLSRYSNHRVTVVGKTLTLTNSLTNLSWIKSLTKLNEPVARLHTRTHRRTCRKQCLGGPRDVRRSTGADFHRAMVGGGDCSRIQTPHMAPPCEELDPPYDIKLVFCAEKLHMFLEKSTKTAATRAALFDSNIHQIVCRLALRPRCYWGPYSASRDPLAVFRGPTSKRRGGRGEEEKGKGGREFVLCPRKKKKSRCLCDEGINIRVSSQNAVIALTASLNRLDHHRNYGCQRCLHAASDAHSQNPHSSSSGLFSLPFPH